MTISTRSHLLALLLCSLALTGAAAVVPAPAQQHASYRKTHDGVLLPDPHATPGAIDQNVNQANIPDNHLPAWIHQGCQAAR